MELLVVVAIMSILMAVVVPASIAMIKANNLTNAANMIRDELSLARQTALSRNQEVEVRFYQMASGGDASTKRYRAFRAFVADGLDPAKSEPLSSIKYFNEPVVISEDPKFSTLLDYTDSSRSGLRYLTEDVPEIGSTPYVAFSFRGNGETSLKPVVLPAGNWFLTLISHTAKTNGGTGLPDNYSTIQVDPVTGRIRTYRP